MRFYNQPHRFYCGVDLHARTMYLVILDHAGQVVFDHNLAAVCGSRADAATLRRRKIRRCEYSSALSSSAENCTYWPLENSYPLPISSFSTTVPSFEQMYCCFSRELHVVCSMLKLTLADDSLDE